MEKTVVINRGIKQNCYISWGLSMSEDAVFPHPGTKRAGVETKEERCPVFALNAPPGFLEDLQDVVLF